MSRKGRDYLQDERVQARLRQLDDLRVEQRKVDLKHIMSTQVGRRFVYDLLFDKCGLMNVYPGQDSGVYRHEGRREVGQDLAREIQAVRSNDYITMINEHLMEVQEFNKLREAALKPSANDQETEDA